MPTRECDSSPAPCNGVQGAQLLKLQQRPLVMYLARLEAVKPAKPGQYKPGQARPKVLASSGFWPGLRFVRAKPSRLSRGFEHTTNTSLDSTRDSSKQNINDHIHDIKKMACSDCEVSRAAKYQTIKKAFQQLDLNGTGEYTR